LEEGSVCLCSWVNDDTSRGEHISIPYDKTSYILILCDRECDYSSSRIGAVVASNCSLTVVQRVRRAGLMSRVFCKIDPTWRNTTWSLAWVLTGVFCCRPEVEPSLAQPEKTAQPIANPARATKCISLSPPRATPERNAQASLASSSLRSPTG
jgi:hypothetical protein